MGDPTLKPWRLTTNRQRQWLADLLSSFRGLVMIDGSRTASADEEPNRLDPQLLAGVKDLLNLYGDLEHQAWIVVSSHRSMPPAVLHAVVEPLSHATVDLLLAVPPLPGGGAGAYRGFGEMRALDDLVLEPLAISRLALPIALDIRESGLGGRGWVRERPGLYVAKGRTSGEESAETGGRSTNGGRPDEIWEELVVREHQFYGARMRLFSSSSDADVDHLVGRALQDPGERHTALRLLPLLEEQRWRPFLAELVDIAFNGPRDMQMVQDLVRSMDEGWLASKLPQILQVVLEREPPYTEEEIDRAASFLRLLDPRLVDPLRQWSAMDGNG